MHNYFRLTRRPRLQIASVVACAGLLVSILMVVKGGDLARHLPDQGFHVAALIGAGLSGWCVADGLGLAGRRGCLLSVLWFSVATLIGAALGATLGMVVVLPWTTGFVLPEFAEFVTGLPMLAAFGWLAVLDGLFTSFAVAVSWIAACILVHVAAFTIRGRGAIQQSIAPF